MPWMGVGVYFPAAAAAGAGVALAGFEALAGFGAFAGFLAALLRAAGFFAVARFFMPRTLPPPFASVNAPAGAAARRSAA
jgi:hypothetical protein